MINRKRTFLLLGLVAFAVLLSWLSAFLEPRKPGLKTAIARPESDYRVASLDTSKFRKDGELHFRLRAKTLTHFPGRGHSRLEQPLLLQYGDNGNIIETRANHALLADTNKTIEMRDEVVTTQHDKHGKLLAQAKTSQLTLRLQP